MTMVRVVVDPYQEAMIDIHRVESIERRNGSTIVTMASGNTHYVTSPSYEELIGLYDD